MTLLGLDVGTTGCKAIAYNTDGDALAEARREYPLSSPAPNCWELDATEVWACCRDCIRSVAAATTGNPISALAISALGEAVVAVDEQFLPLAGAPISADLRATAQAEALGQTIGRSDIYATTGQPLSPLHHIIFVMP